MLQSGLLCLTLLALTSAIRCPDGETCHDGSACCLTNTGRYGCCPLTRSLPMVHASSGNDGNDEACPDGSRCPSEYSCVKSHHTYRCCPLSQGVSCSDGKHCCPEGHRCSEDGHSCEEEKGLVGAVFCPDGESECPDETTCCQLPDSSWGCCPHPEAVCCEDKEHCCPHASTCDLAHSKCRSPTFGDTPMRAKLPARRRAAWEGRAAVRAQSYDSKVKDPTTMGLTSVACPDGRSYCPDATTCCQFANGTYGCCPLPNAVCCEDHLHCCPEGTTCVGNTSQCSGASGSVPWLVKVPALTHSPNKARNVTCDSTHACPDGSTCCKTETGDWACCPLVEAVCCEDHVHCCPKDTTCDVAAGKCNGPSRSIPWLEKVPALTHSPNKARGVTCDSTHACPDDKTCCKTETGDWACCPLPEVPALKTPPPEHEAPFVRCNGTVVCPGSSTCCMGIYGAWVCCPYAGAVCCPDHIHCCPGGTYCNPATGACHSTSGSVPWLENVPALTHSPKNVGNVQCDSTHACPDGSTCCKTDTGDWACCPLVEAVCCEDHVHCCPKDTTCDVAAGKCNDPSRSIPWLEKVPALTHSPNKARGVTCDSTHACPDDKTCCKTETGDWACCPLPEVPALKTPPPEHEAPFVRCNGTVVCPGSSTCCLGVYGAWVCCPYAGAVCCPDHIHCCPGGTYCNPATGRCHSTSGSVPWLEKVPALTHSPNKARNVTCDSTHACPDGSTCCKTDTGDWACCPLVEAVCCEDHVHCCPKDTTCDVAAGKCNGPSRSIPWLEKVAALTHSPNKARGVTCDSTHACPDDKTCCKTETGDWACCPLPEVPALKTPPPEHEAPFVRCNGTVVCPGSSTCCMGVYGAWACCPYAGAVCCPDHIHCCPGGTYCNPATGACHSTSGSVPWLENVPALTHSPKNVGNVQCDSTHACPDGSTCCKTDTGDWACCPLVEAVCCEDHVHCCPKDTTCDVAAGKCNSPSRSIPWLEKVPALTHSPNKARGVTCDSTHACPDDKTCCKTETGDWACCPLPEVPALKTPPPEHEAPFVRCNGTVVCPGSSTCCLGVYGAWVCCPYAGAVCCPDHIHCCPGGTYCNPATGRCHSTSGSVPWLEKVPALAHSPNKARNVTCDSTHACPDGSTCCKTDTGDWACCPLVEAVCCEDHVHCCPKDTTCDVAAGKCNGPSRSIPWLEKVAALTHSPNKARGVTCDSTHACPDDKTCCKTETGDWACCPLPEVPALKTPPPEHEAPFVRCNGTVVCPGSSTCCLGVYGAWVCCPYAGAVCCPDHIHCCPSGTYCNPATGRCHTASGSLPWLEKVPALTHSPNKARNVLCDSTHACPDDNTCCKTETGKWGCCPLPEAVCCEDKKHCCPKGYSCDISGLCHSSGQLRWDNFRKRLTRL